ncbi:hypothetical protein ABGV42_01010 [Paenibacillus pabuli]|uniref:hypothetical protein n=1 Tax=Paenibacillus pabuli TaxID=1472 RepID=UPI0032423FF6
MLKDFYYSRMMQRSASNEIPYTTSRHRIKMHTVNINGKELPFTIQVDHGTENPAKWPDLVFLGTADDSNITYNFI